MKNHANCWKKRITVIEIESEQNDIMRAHSQAGVGKMNNSFYEKKWTIYGQNLSKPKLHTTRKMLNLFPFLGQTSFRDGRRA